MLTDFLVAKFQPFVEPTQVELRPLTLVYGRNAAGKSALVRALPIVVGALQGRGAGPLDLTVPAMRGSSYRELATHLLSSGEIELGCGWVDARGKRESLKVMLRGTGAQLERQLIDKCSLRGGVNVDYSLDWADLSYDVTRGEEVRKHQVDFTGIVPRLYLDGLAIPRNTRAEWLGPNRPASLSPAEDHGPSGITTDGSGCRRLLAESKRTDSGLLCRVSADLKRVVGQHVDVLLHPAIDAFTVMVGPAVTQDRMVRLSNGGEGAFHVLPVLVALELSERESAPDHVVIEQPEIHLHPHAECELGKLLAETAQRPTGPRYLVETHSENVLLGVQLAIVEGRLNADRVILYFVTQDEDGRSRAQRVTLDERGQPDDVISQPFGEGLALTRALFEARRVRLSRLL
jgi:hypothetical protein